MNFNPGFTNLDRFLFYFLMPTMVVALLGGYRYYQKKRYQGITVFKISSDLIFGNFIAIYLTFALAVFLYFYILNLNFLKDLPWELLTLISFIFLSFPIGLGIGAHITAITLERLLYPLRKKNLEIVKALHFFHFPFSHDITFSSFLLMAYLLILLDLFKGRTMELAFLQIGITVVTGIILGMVASVMFIITKSHKLIFKPTLVLTISLGIVTWGESRNISQHPVSFLFTTSFITVVLGILIYRQTKINLRPLAKKVVKRWLQWDIDNL